MLIFMRALRILSLSLYIFFMYTSCSLNYASIDTTKSSSPEFVFYDVQFTRTEENKKNMQMTATQLEQYSGLDAMYLENASFTTYDSNEVLNITGSCKLLSADMDKDIYHFFGDVHIISYEHDAEVLAQNLRWNNNTEVLSSELSDKVSISTGSTKNPTNENNSDSPNRENDFSEAKEQTRILIEGTGFSANGIDLSYSFNESIEGSIIEETADNNEQVEVANEN